MEKTRCRYNCYIIILLCSFLSCNGIGSGSLPYVAIIVGTASCSRDSHERPLKELQTIRPSDVVNVNRESKIKLAFPNDKFVYVNETSVFRFGMRHKNSNGKDLMEMYLDHGELYIFRNSSVAQDSFLFVMPNATVRFSDADVAIDYERNSRSFSATVLSGAATIGVHGEQELRVPACTRIVAENETVKLLEISKRIINELTNWVGKTAIEAAHSESNCGAQNSGAQNLPPEWKCTPRKVCSEGGIFIDTLRAGDPEGTQVAYFLVHGPEGMILDRFSGEIRYKAKKSGTYTMHIKAIDADSQSSDLQYTLTISSLLTVVLTVPRVVKPHEVVAITASPSRKSENSAAFTYRFDFDNDGVFDFPEKAQFGTSATVSHAFGNEGEYRITVEMKDAFGKISSASQNLIVNEPPRASLSITPSSGTVGTAFAIDARGCSDSRDSGEALLIRFDTDGDGLWDFPPGGEFFKDKKINYSWDKPGVYRLILQVADTHGSTDTASVQVQVHRGLVVDAVIAPDSAYANDSIQLKCVVNNPEFPVTAYMWSFDNDTVFEQKTIDAVAYHRFRKAGSYNVLCRAVDEKGQTGVQQKLITIVNSSCIVDAGGPYKGRVNAPVAVSGSAKDVHSRIVAYLWDFNGDGNTDWSSPDNADASHVFSRSGHYTMYLTVETDDGSMFRDSAKVTITNTPPVARAGDDIVAKPNRKVKLSGIGEDSDGPIIRYSWDFDADGQDDWSSVENGVVEHVFQKYSVAVFTVMDSDSMRASDTVRIIICPDDMRTIEDGKFCIDTYEYPNRKGELPKLDISYEEARAVCLQEGKRLCTAKEWVMACQNGQERNKYPYGRNFQIERCNTMGNPFVKNKVSVSGHFAECAGSAGIFDMSGNVAEWTEGSDGKPYVYGGSYQNGEERSRCDSRIQLSEGRNYFYTGFRCCK